MYNIRYILAALTLSLACVLPSWAQVRTNQLYWNYINQYKGMAVEQMQRYRIPASITLAQGLLESDAGRSTLATKANNHFGIKVSNGWTGPYILRDDDRRNEKFRKYKSARDSYEDHSRFLQGKRYQSLFQLRITDYKGWAKGLKACGYATSPTYAQQLIRIIEMYNLSQFDNGKVQASMISHIATPAAPTQMRTETKVYVPTGGFKIKAPQTKKEAEALSRFFREHQVLRNNGVYFIIVNVGDNMATISKETGLSLRKLYTYNDLPNDYAPTAGDVIYLAKKKKCASREFRDNPIHVVEPNQSIFDIAQLYAIRLEYLYKMNLWDFNHSIQPGEIIRIR